MSTRVVPLRISKKILEEVDKLVELGVFNSRSEALRELVKIGLRNYEKLTRIAKGVEKLFELEENEGDIPVELRGALKELLEERKKR